MNKPLKVLIVEDNGCFQDQARRELAPFLRLVDLSFVPSMGAARDRIWDADAVITDVFFPEYIGAEEMRPGEDVNSPNGLVMVKMCLRLGLPVVAITSTYHHGRKTDLVCSEMRKLNIEMFDWDIQVRYKGDYKIMERSESSEKPWREAMIGLLILVIGIELNKITITRDKLMGGVLVQHLPHIAMRFLDPERREEVKSQHAEIVAQLEKMGL